MHSISTLLCGFIKSETLGNLLSPRVCRYTGNIFNQKSHPYMVVLPYIKYEQLMNLEPRNTKEIKFHNYSTNSVNCKYIKCNTTN